MNYRLVKDNPNKRFYFPNPKPCCEDMKLNTLENLVKCLETEENVVEVSGEIRERALVPLNRMLELAK